MDDKETVSAIIWQKHSQICSKDLAAERAQKIHTGILLLKQRDKDRGLLTKQEWIDSHQTPNEVRKTLGLLTREEAAKEINEVMAKYICKVRGSYWGESEYARNMWREIAHSAIKAVLQSANKQEENKEGK